MNNIDVDPDLIRELGEGPVRGLSKLYNEATTESIPIGEGIERIFGSSNPDLGQKFNEMYGFLYKALFETTVGVSAVSDALIKLSDDLELTESELSQIFDDAMESIIESPDSPQPGIDRDPDDFASRDEDDWHEGSGGPPRDDNDFDPDGPQPY